MMDNSKSNTKQPIVREASERARSSADTARAAVTQDEFRQASPVALDEWENDGGSDAHTSESVNVPFPTLSAASQSKKNVIKPPILAALNKQIQHEQTNAHTYQAVSLYFGRLNLHGLEAFMAQQVEDERMHAEKFIRHAADRSGQVKLADIPAPKVDFASPLEAVECVRDLEQTTTAMIYHLFELARNEGDHALETLLHWFIDEQVEEEKWSSELVVLMQQFHEHPGQVFMLDHQWGKRVKAK